MPSAGEEYRFNFEEEKFRSRECAKAYIEKQIPRIVAAGNRDA